MMRATMTTMMIKLLSDLKFAEKHATDLYAAKKQVAECMCFAAASSASRFWQSLGSIYGEVVCDQQRSHLYL